MLHTLILSIVCCTSISYAANTLVAHWSFDSLGEGTYYDVTDNGFDATLQKGSAAIAEGVKNDGLNCNSDSFLVSIQSSDSAFNFSEFTIEGWIYSSVDLVNPGSFFNSHLIFTTQTWIPSGLAEGYEISIDDRGHLHLAMAKSTGGGWIICTSDSILKPQTWYHVAGTYDGTTMKVYINGRLSGSLSNSSGYSPSHGKAVIGCQMPADSSQWRNWFRGKIDELKLYNFALDEQTLQSIFNELKPEDEPPFEINVGMKSIFAQPDDTVTMPIYLTNFEDFSISACQFALTFDTSIVELIGMSSDSGIIRNWLFAWNLLTSDSASIALAGAMTSISYGEGEIVRGIFRIKSNAVNGDTCFIRLSNINIDEKYNLITATNIDGKIIIGEDNILYGDVTGNDEVNIYDAQYVLSYVVGALQLTDTNCCLNFTTAVADVSGNGFITSYDAALILQYSVGMLPEFPVVQMSQRRLLKKLSVPSPEIASVLMTIDNTVGNEITYNIVGSNLKGFVAGEFNIQYDPLIVNPIKSSFSTTVRGATLNSKIEPDNKLLKIAIVTNNDIDVNDPVTLFRITQPSVINNVSAAFAINTALLNEGKIIGKINNESVKTRFRKSGIVNSAYTVYVNGSNVTIMSNNTGPLEIKIWSLNGKSTVYKKFKETSISQNIHISHMSTGVYLYQIRNGKNTAKGKFLIAK